MKKFLKVFLLCMAVLTVLTVAVSAADITLYADGVNNHTEDLDAPEGKTYTWVTPDGEYIEVNPSTGLITALKAKNGTATVYVMEADAVVETYNVTVKNRDLTSIKIDQSPNKTTYYSGQSFNADGLKVIAVYDNLDEEELASNKYTYEPTGALNVGDTAVTITYVENGVTKTATQTITVKEVLPVEVTIAIPTKDQLKEEDSFPAIVVTVKNNDGSTAIAQDEYVVKLNGEVINASTKKMAMSDNGAKVKVVYKGVESKNEVTLTVLEKWNPTVEYSGSLSLKTYEVGDKLDWTGLEVVIKNNGEVIKTYDATALNSMSAFAKTFTSEDVGTRKEFKFEIAPNSSKPTEKVEVVVSGLTIKEKRIEVVLDGSPKKSYKNGDAFDWTGVYAITLKKNGTNVISFTSNEIKEIASLKYTFDEDDVGVTKHQFTITYNGEAYTFEITGLAVTEKATFEPEAKIVGTFTNKTYKVGDTLNWAGVTMLLLKDKNSTEVDEEFNAAELLTLSSSSPLAYKFKSTDAGTNKTIVIKYTSEAGHEYEIKVEGLTIQDTLGQLNPSKLTGLVLDKVSYPVGYTFSIADIYYIQYTKSLNGNPFTAYGAEVERYTDTMSLEVLTANGSRKSFLRHNYRSVIEPEDIYTENGEKVVTVRFYMGSDYVYVDTQVAINEAAVTVTYQNRTIGTYEDIDEAVRAVNALSTTEYPISGSSVVITLGKDQKISTLVKLQVTRYLEIDLNGYQLTFYTNTVNSNMNQRYGLTISNSATTAGKFVYYGKTPTLSLEKGESFVFYHDYDKDTQLPGFYTVTLDYGTDGKVTSSPSATNKTVVVGHGSNLTLTITPNNKYVVSEVKVDTTKYNKNDDEYTEKANNVVGFVIRVTDNYDIGIKFAKSATADDPTDTSDWENPFTDVSSYATYYDAVAFVNQNGLFKGTSTTKFSPSATMTRAMFVTVLGRLAGIDEYTASRVYGTTSKFTDVSKSDPRYDYYSYAVPYIAWATQNGIIEGHGGAEKGTFGPEDPITHQQMYVIMQRYAASIAKKPLTSTSGINLPYTDKAQIAEWAEYAVKVAYVNEYIITTSTNRISPTTNATRAELAMLIEKFAKNVLEWGVIDEK